MSGSIPDAAYLQRIQPAVGDDVSAIAVFVEKTVFRQRCDSSQAMGACFVRLRQLAFGGR